MSPEELDSLKASTTFKLLDRITVYEPLFNALLVSTEKLSKDLTGEATKWDMTDHKQEVGKLRAYAEDLKFCGEIIEKNLISYEDNENFLP